MNRYLILLLFSSAWAQAQNLEITGPDKSVHLSLREMKSKLRVATIDVEDPVYAKAMKYDAFALEDVLNFAGASAQDKADEIVFTAVDGYAPNMSFDRLKSLNGYVAFQEHGQNGRFPLVAQGKAKISPGPFYVVWVKEKSVQDDVPWPYQLAKIEVVDWAKKYPRVVPPKVSADSDERKGFALFKAECIRCHSINMQGGEVGPELNAPQNVTEYWKTSVLKDFIHDASSFRYKSKMPSFKSLKDDQIALLLKYLTYMKAYKIQPDRI